MSEARDLQGVTPATTYRRNPERPLLAGVDVGGTKLAVGVLGRDGHVYAADPRETGHAITGPEVVRNTREMLEIAVRRAGGNLSDVPFVGVAAPGPLSRSQRRLLALPNNRGLSYFSIGEEMDAAFACDVPLKHPVVLANDASAAALGEDLFGAARHMRDEGKAITAVAYFTISTGVGGGFVQEGRIVHGADGNAAEFGHQIVVPFGGAPCPCGGQGHLESYVSGTSIARRAREALNSPTPSSLRDVPLDRLTSKEVVDAVRAGDPLAVRLWAETAECLGIGIANVVHLCNPDVVILGGGVSKAGDLLIKPAFEAAQKRVMPDLRETFSVVRARNEENVGVWGAIGLAHEAGIWDFLNDRPF